MVETPSKIVLQSDIGPVYVQPQGFTRVLAHGGIRHTAARYNAEVLKNDKGEWYIASLWGSTGWRTSRDLTIHQKRRVYYVLPGVIKAWANDFKASNDAMGKGGIAYTSKRLAELERDLVYREERVQDATLRRDQCLAEIAELKRQLNTYSSGCSA